MGQLGNPLVLYCYVFDDEHLMKRLLLIPTASILHPPIYMQQYFDQYLSRWLALCHRVKIWFSHIMKPSWISSIGSLYMSPQTCLLDCLTTKTYVETQILPSYVHQFQRYRRLKISENLSGGHFEKSIKNNFLMAGFLGAFFLWLVELNGLQKRYNRSACNFVRVGL